MFDDAKSANGTAVTTAKAVPHKAICNVMTISSTYIRHCRKFGGKNSAAYWLMLPESRINSAGRMSAPFQEAASNKSKKAHDMYQVRLRLGAAVWAKLCNGGWVTDDMRLNSKKVGHTSSPNQWGSSMHTTCSEEPAAGRY